MPSLKLLLERFYHQDPSNSQSVFVAVATRARLNMDQDHPINNRTVKFVVSCCVVSKQVEVSTILASVESPYRPLATCWCLSRCLCVEYVVLEILHDIVRAHLLMLLINQLLIWKETWNADIYLEIDFFRTVILSLLHNRMLTSCDRFLCKSLSKKLYKGHKLYQEH